MISHYSSQELKLRSSQPFIRIRFFVVSQVLFHQSTILFYRLKEERNIKVIFLIFMASVILFNIFLNSFCSNMSLLLN
jgi:hypothetical protein